MAEGRHSPRYCSLPLWKYSVSLECIEFDSGSFQRFWLGTWNSFGAHLAKKKMQRHFY